MFTYQFGAFVGIGREGDHLARSRDRGLGPNVDEHYLTTSLSLA
jgi:hypothetical protein